MENLGPEQPICPFCKATIELPPGKSIENLPSPLYLTKLQEAGKDSKKSILHIMDCLYDQISSCRAEIKRVDESYKTVEQRIITARQEVMKKIEDFISFLRKHGDKVLAELDGIYKDQQVSIIKQRKELELHLGKMQKTHEYANDVLERDIEGEILDMEGPVSRPFQQFSTKPKKVPLNHKKVLTWITFPIQIFCEFFNNRISGESP